jgi:hypothetical protein
MDLPLVIRCPDSRNEEDCVTALCMLLARLVHPGRHCDFEMQFGWETTRFSRITRITARFLFDRWKHLLRFNPHRLTQEKLAAFAAVIHAKGAPVDFVPAFIDGTLQNTARPVFNQRIVFNGWKRRHCLKYQCVLTPDGIVIHIFGPVEGRRHDLTVYRQSGLQSILDAHFWSPNGTQLCIYGDPAYSRAPHLISPYKGSAISAEQSKFNFDMSRVRESVEWVFKEVHQQFPFLDFSRNQKILKTPCGLYYLVAILLCNAHTILHCPQIPQYFGCLPPSLEEYFQGGPIEDEDLDAWCLDSPWHDINVPSADNSDNDLE